MAILKNILGILIIVCGISCTDTSTSKQGKYLQSQGNQYLIQLENFDKALQQTIKASLDNKTFDLGDRNEAVLIEDRQKGHTFFLDQPIKGFRYVTKVKKYPKPDPFKVNVQTFVNEKGQLRRVFNPGDFDMMRYSEMNGKSEVENLQELLVQLTYK